MKVRDLMLQLPANRGEEADVVIIIDGKRHIIKDVDYNLTEVEIHALKVQTPRPLPEGCTIPENHELILQGNLRSSDWLWSPDDKKWMHPTREDFKCIGSDIQDYYFVARKVK